MVIRHCVEEAVNVSHNIICHHGDGHSVKEAITFSHKVTHQCANSQQYQMYHVLFRRARRWWQTNTRHQMRWSRSWRTWTASGRTWPPRPRTRETSCVRPHSSRCWTGLWMMLRWVEQMTFRLGHAHICPMIFILGKQISFWDLMLWLLYLKMTRGKQS